MLDIVSIKGVESTYTIGGLFRMAIPSLNSSIVSFLYAKYEADSMFIFRIICGLFVVARGALLDFPKDPYVSVNLIENML